MSFFLRKMTIEEAERDDIALWKSMSPEDKLDELQRLRELYYELNNESRKRFQRLYRVVKQA